MPEIEEPLRPTAMTVIGSFWFWLWRRIAAAPQPPVRPPGSTGLIVVLAVCLAAAAGLALMIALLQSSRVRAAFRHPPEPATRNAG